MTAVNGNRRVYVASSWRNPYQPAVVERLRHDDHEVYDFRNPEPGDNGFHWSEIDPGWENWNAYTYIRSLRHGLAIDGFGKDFAAMEWADTFVLILPCGRSAHLELGWAVGAGKRTAIWVAEDPEPELMYKMVDLITPTFGDIVAWVGSG